jgi:WD40 repeat protein
VDVKREHSVVLFNPLNPKFEEAAIEKSPGGSVTYFAATPDGKGLVLLKGSAFTVYRPHYKFEKKFQTSISDLKNIVVDMSDFSKESSLLPSIEVCLSTKLFENDCSPFHWLETTSEGIEFLTTSVRGQLLHFRLSLDFSKVELLRTVSSPFSGSLYHLIWNDQHGTSPEFGELIRVGMFGLETERLPLQNRAPAGSSVATTSNSLHNLTCCGISFDSTGDLLAIGDWSGVISIWSTAEQTAHPTAEPNLKLQLQALQDDQRGDIVSELRQTAITPKKDSVGEKSSPAGSYSPTSPISKPKWTVNVRHSMVRALEWNRHPYNDGRKTIMIGDTSGRLLECSFFEDPLKQEVAPVITKISKTYRTITCMAWSPSSTPNIFLAENPSAQVYKCFLAVGDSDGKLRIFGRSAENDHLKLLVKIQAHELMPHVTSRDIWTLAFSPCGRYIATGSEDYTVHVYRFGIENESDLELIQVLEGADAAVTCIDWQMTPFGSTLISASDDRTIHCWTLDEQTGSLQLFRMIRTNWEHLMITYACLEANSSRITCTTMSGYVYVFDLAVESYRLRCKLHLGSIEGLAWNRAKPSLSQVAVCSSDCTSTLLRIPSTPVQ